MPLADLGATIINEDGSVIPSKNIIQLPSGAANLPVPGYSPNMSGIAGLNPSAPTPVGRQTGPVLYQKQGDPNNLPTTSIPSEIYQAGASEAPDRKALQPHGLHKVGNILASLAAGPYAPLLYHRLQNVPYQEAQSDWQNRLNALKPAVETQLAQTRERGEAERATAALAERERSRESLDADRKQRENAATIKIADDEKRQADLENQRAAQLKRQQARDDLARQLASAKAKQSAEGQLTESQVNMLYGKEQQKTLTPEEKAELAGYRRKIQETKTDPGVARMIALGNTRGISMLDSQNNNAPVELTWNQIIKASNDEPGRYVPAQTGVHALGQEAQFQTIDDNTDRVEQALGNIGNEGFSKLDRVKIALALRDNDPKGTVNQLVSSGALGVMSPQQQEYIIALGNLVESAQAIRKTVGGGQGRDVRSAIEAIIPGAHTPSVEYAKKQLESFKQTIGTLHKGVPKVSLRSDIGASVKHASGPVKDPTKPKYKVTIHRPTL